MKHFLPGLVGAVAIAVAFAAIANAGPAFDAEGKLVVPKGTDRWPTVGTTVALSYESESSTTFNTVRMDPESYEVYRKTGAFPVGTMLELEIRRQAKDVGPAIGGSYAGKLVTYSMHTKDEKGGPGTWTFYSYGPGATQGRPIARTETCYTCHAEHARQDQAFTQFYPILEESHVKAKAGQ